MKRFVLTFGMVLTVGLLFAQNTEPAKKLEKTAIKKQDVKYVKKSEVKAVKLDKTKQIVPASESPSATRKKVVVTETSKKK